MAYMIFHKVLCEDHALATAHDTRRLLSSKFVIRDSVLKREPLLECSDFDLRFTVEELEFRMHTPRLHQSARHRQDRERRLNGGASMVVLRRLRAPTCSTNTYF